MIRAARAKVAERIQGMDAEELAVGQIPAALRTLIELEFKVLVSMAEACWATGAE